MQLKGAEIRDFYRLTADMPGGGANLKFPKKVKIPHYQRPYKWDEENISKLIEDWYSEQGDQYFAGSIVTVNNERTGFHELIDGQQRYTTIFLANFVRFLVSRVALRQAVSETSKIIHVTKVMDSYIEAAKFLFLNDPNADYPLEVELEALSSLVTSGFDDMEDVQKFSETRQKLLEFVGLPDLSEDSEDYLDEHALNLDRFLEAKSLALSYDRKSFDVAILESLKRTCVYLNEHKSPQIEFLNRDDAFSEHEARYLDALEVIFQRFYALSKTRNLKPFECAKDIIVNISKFLEEISLCVVQTGNAEDAYTLFEVLNDRSLALDDLDLIKNQFYKNFVLKNSYLRDEDVDSTLQDLDDQWVDRIFSNQGDQKRKLVAYLAIVFITGDASIVYNRGDGYRRSIQNYLESLDNYSKDLIRKHFNVFQACKIILDLAGVRFKSKDLVALESEFRGDDSILKKTICLLMALGQEGVLSGLISFVLKFIEKGGNEGGDTQSMFDPKAVEEEVQSYLSSDIPETVKSQAYRVWQLTMLSGSSDLPREFSIDLIKHNNIDSEGFDLRSSNDLDKAKEEFDDWISSWRYGGAQLKARILFAKLISMTPNESLDRLQRKNIALSVDEVGKLQLDHMEANKPDAVHLEKYFDDDDRDNFIQGLGNMMPLPAKENIEKGNKPLKESFSFYDQAGIGPGHHLYDSAWKLFREQQNDNGVPKKEFFQKRKEHLRKLFLLAVNTPS